jgi:hypothetical protein
VTELQQKLQHALDGRERALAHAEHLQQDLMDQLETRGRVTRLLDQWKKDRAFFLQGEGVRGRTEALNWLDKHIQELSDALNVDDGSESPRKEEI